MLPGQLTGWTFSGEPISATARFTGEDGKPGTCFLIRHNDERLLVTARHLCTGEVEETVQVRNPWWNGAQPWTLTLRRRDPFDAPGDFAAFMLPDDVSGRSDMPYLVLGEDLMAGWPCWALGFPFLLASRITTLSGQEAAMVKMGTLCGTDVANGLLIQYADIIANPGFSGGPLVYRSIQDGHMHLAGMVFGNVKAPVEEPNEEVPDPPMTNAGMLNALSAWSIGAILDGTWNDDDVRRD